MGFWSDVGNFFGNAIEVDEWGKAFEKGGQSLVQVHIRNFLRASSKEERDRKRDRLATLSTYTGNGLDAMQRFATIHAIFLDEEATMKEERRKRREK